MKYLSFLIGVTVALYGFMGCKQKEDKSPCQLLVEQEAKCGYEKGASVQECEKGKKTIQIRTALDCLRVKECQQFLRCRKQADELKGIKTGFENL